MSLEQWLVACNALTNRGRGGFGCPFFICGFRQPPGEDGR